MEASHGVLTIRSPYPFGETLERLRRAIQRRELTLFLELDQQAAAAAHGLKMERGTLLLFGQPRGGTPILKAVGEAGIDLPLRIYLWEDREWAVSVSYNDPEYLARRHHLLDELAAPFRAVPALITEALDP